MSAGAGWSIDPEHWVKATELLGNFAPKRIPHTKTMRNIVPQQPGVYIICSGPVQPHSELFDGTFNVLYVGKATNLQDRFWKHLSPGTGVEKIRRCFGYKLEFRYVFEPDPDRRDLIEKAIFDAMGPPGNEISPKHYRGVVGPEVPANP